MVVNVTFKTEAYFTTIIELSEEELQKLKSKLVGENSLFGNDEDNTELIHKILRSDSLEFDYLLHEHVDVDEITVAKFEDQECPNSAKTIPLITLD